MDSAGPDVENKSMVLCMGVATGAISAGAAVIRRQTLQERSWKPPSGRLASGSRLSIWWVTLKQVFPHSPLLRKLGVNYRTAWLLHNKIIQAMSEREKSYALRGKVQLDDADLGGERNRGKPGRGEIFSFAAIADWAQDALARGCEVISDRLTCFRAVAEVGCTHQPVIVNGRHRKDLPDFRWINTVFG